MAKIIVILKGGYKKMKIAKEIVVETLKRIESAEDGELTTEGSEFLMNTSQRICKENPYVAEFIDAVLVGWKKDPPADPEVQLGTIFAALIALVDMFNRQEEVDKLNKQFGGKIGG